MFHDKDTYMVTLNCIKPLEQLKAPAPKEGICLSFDVSNKIESMIQNALAKQEAEKEEDSLEL